MNSPEGELIARVDTLVTLTHAFRALLQREHGQLARWPLAELPDIVREKLALAGRLQQAESERQQCLRLAGHADTDQAAMTAALSASASGRDALQRWLSLHDVARECQDMHQLIGASLNLQARQTLRTLEVLGATRELSVTYGRDGQGRLAGSRQHLGRA